MPFNLLLFPLIGGYYFLVTFKQFKYRFQRVENQKILFNSVIAGAFLLLTSLVLTKSSLWLFPQQSAIIKSNFPLHLPYFGTTVLSFFLGIIAAEAGNLFINEKAAISEAIKRNGNELELLFESSFNKEHLIQLTLKSGKFYIGWVKTLPIPQHSNYVQLLPAFSGYRNGDTKEMIFTTQYLDVYATYVQGGEVIDLKMLTSLVIKIDEILTANIFDMDMYERFNNSYTNNENSSAV